MTTHLTRCDFLGAAAAVAGTPYLPRITDLHRHFAGWSEISSPVAPGYKYRLGPWGFDIY